MLNDALYPSDSWKAMIVWSEPISYDDFASGIIDFPESDPYEIACSLEFENFRVSQPIGDRGPNFYMILGQWGDKKKLFYIGKTTKPTYKRINDIDHVKKRRMMHANHPRHKLLISNGHFFMGDWANKTKRRIDEIESLLIYTNSPKYNDKKKWTNNVGSDFFIKNGGDYKPLYEEIFYGLKVKE